MNDETPRTTDGAKLCSWCGEQIVQTKVGRSRDYCRRSCRQRAYEARKQREATIAAVASAVARTGPVNSSRDETPELLKSSRDETRGRRSAPPIPAPAVAVVPEDDFLLAPPAAAAVEVPARSAMPLPPPGPRKGRRMLPPSPGTKVIDRGVQAELWRQVGQAGQ